MQTWVQAPLTLRGAGGHGRRLIVEIDLEALRMAKHNHVQARCVVLGGGSAACRHCDLMKSLMKPKHCSKSSKARRASFWARRRANGSKAGKAIALAAIVVSLIARIGKLELRAPREGSGDFSTALFERCAHNEKYLVAVDDRRVDATKSMAAILRLSKASMTNSLVRERAKAAVDQQRSLRRVDQRTRATGHALFFHTVPFANTLAGRLNENCLWSPKSAFDGTHVHPGGSSWEFPRIPRGTSWVTHSRPTQSSHPHWTAHGAAPMRDVPGPRFQRLVGP